MTLTRSICFLIVSAGIVFPHRNTHTITRELNIFASQLNILTDAILVNKHKLENEINNLINNLRASLQGTIDQLQRVNRELEAIHHKETALLASLDAPLAKRASIKTQQLWLNDAKRVKVDPS